MSSRLSLKEHLNRVYPDRRDRYGYTVLSRSRALRAIKPSDDEVVRRIISGDLLDQLVSARVILAPRIIRDARNEYVFLIQKRIRPATVPSEWSSTMFADAALLILRAEIALCPLDMTVDDPHPWNVLFHEGRPYLVDMGAFNVAGTGLHWSAKTDAELWPAASVFNAFFLNVIALSVAGRGHYVRRTLTDWNPVSGSDAALLLIKSPAVLMSFLRVRIQAFFVRGIWKLIAPLASLSVKRRFKLVYLNALTQHVERMRERIVRRLEHHPAGMDISVAATKAVASLAAQHTSRRFVTYGASRSAIEFIHAAGAAKLHVVSPNEALIDSLYQMEAESLTGAVMDLRSPTAGSGPGNRWIAPAMERFNAEIGIFFFDLAELVIEKCLTVSELIQAARKLCGITGLIVLRKLPQEHDRSGRNYGQTSDEVLLAGLEQNLEAFEIIYNDMGEMAVAFGRKMSLT